MAPADRVPLVEQVSEVADRSFPLPLVHGVTSQHNPLDNPSAARWPILMAAERADRAHPGHRSTKDGPNQWELLRDTTAGQRSLRGGYAGSHHVKVQFVNYCYGTACFASLVIMGTDGCSPAATTAAAFSCGASLVRG